MKMKRPVDVCVLSDVHLGTSACRAAELNAYLKSIAPARLVLCGDIIDMWRLRSAQWSEAQTKVVRRILKFAAQGVPVHYVCGNHDGALRRYAPFAAGAIGLVDRLELDLAGRRTWFIHGDAVEMLLGTPRWLSRLGSISYDTLESLSGCINRVRGWFGAGKVSLATRFKDGLPAARRHVARYEEAVARFAARAGYAAVVCGHIHVAAQRMITVDGRTVEYLNSGDWVDSLSALEFADGAWRVVRWTEMLEAGLVPPPRPADEALEETVAAATMGTSAA